MGTRNKSYFQIMETRTYLKMELFILKKARQENNNFHYGITRITLCNTFFRYPPRRYKAGLQTGSNQLHTIYLSTTKIQVQSVPDGFFTDFELQTIISYPDNDLPGRKVFINAFK